MDNQFYRRSLEYNFQSVMAKDPVAKFGYDTARNMDMEDEIDRLKQVIVALSAARNNLMRRHGHVEEMA